jgi:ribosomal-protein-alanine N-acetyltransferase
MIISHATARDLDGILALERLGFAKPHRWSRDSWAAELSEPNRLVLSRHDARGDLIGVATFSVGGDIVDLLRVVVHPDRRRQGIGTSLVRTGLEWARAIGAARMLLEVRPDNKAAVKTYAKLGFEKLTRRRDYYGTGVDALVMAVAL